MYFFVFSIVYALYILDSLFYIMASDDQVQQNTGAQRASVSHNASIYSRRAPSSARTLVVGRIGRVASPRTPERHLPALLHAVSRGKDIRRDFEHLLETSLWPCQPARFTHGDLVKVMEAFPGVSSASLEMAISTTRYFEVSRAQSQIVRRCFAAMVAMEQNARVRRLLPVDGDPSSAVQPVRDIDALCKRHEGRNTSLSFE